MSGASGCKELWWSESPTEEFVAGTCQRHLAHLSKCYVIPYSLYGQLDNWYLMSLPAYLFSIYASFNLSPSHRCCAVHGPVFFCQAHTFNTNTQAGLEHDNKILITSLLFPAPRGGSVSCPPLSQCNVLSRCCSWVMLRSMNLMAQQHTALARMIT